MVLSARFPRGTQIAGRAKPKVLRLTGSPAASGAPCWVFWYSVGPALLTLPVAHVQSKVAGFSHPKQKWRKNVESQETPARILPRSEEHTSELQSLRHLVCR